MYNFDEANSRIGTSCTKWDRYESRYNLKDVTALWVADMDFNCPPEVSKAMIHRAEHGIFGYTDPTEDCLQAIIDWEKRHHEIDVKKEDIVLTTGVVYAMYTAIEMLVKPDEKVMVMTPVYPPFFNTPASLSREVIYCPLILKPEVRIDLVKMEEQLKHDSSIKVLIFCNPHNPVGKSWTKEELRELLEITDRYGITVISDEIHADLVFQPLRHVSMLGVDQQYNHHIILLGAPTKTFNLAGMKISYALIPHREMCTEFAKRAKASGLSSINIFGFEALTAAYNHGDVWLKECLNYIYENMVWLKGFLNEHLPLCKYDVPESTYLAWVDFSGYDVPDNFAEILKFEGHVELQDGRGFKDSDGYQRINCACPRATLEKGMQRVVSCMKEKGWLS